MVVEDDGSVTAPYKDLSLTIFVQFQIIFYEKILNPIALRKTKIACNFDLSECNRVNDFFL